MNKNEAIETMTQLNNTVNLVLQAGENQVGDQIYYHATEISLALNIASYIERFSEIHDVVPVITVAQVEAEILGGINEDDHSYYYGQLKSAPAPKPTTVTSDDLYEDYDDDDEDMLGDTTLAKLRNYQASFLQEEEE